MKLLSYMIGAIEDWKEMRISAERLVEIFRVSYYEVRSKLLGEEIVEGKWRDMPTEKIAEILLSCKEVNS